MLTPERTIISQYANSPVINAMVQVFNAALDPGANIRAFFNLIWDVDTAEGYGLDVWGRIVGVSRAVQVQSGKYFGFAQQGDATLVGTFGQAPFYSGQVTSTGSTALTDQAYRTLIFAKALANITDGSIKSINAILMTLFPGRGNCYCTDGQNMTMTYTFTFPLSAVEVAIVGSSGVLPRPPGVNATIALITS